MLEYSDLFTPFFFNNFRWYLLLICVSCSILVLNDCHHEVRYDLYWLFKFLFAKRNVFFIFCQVFWLFLFYFLASWIIDRLGVVFKRIMGFCLCISTFHALRCFFLRRNKFKLNTIHNFWALHRAVTWKAFTWFVILDEYLFTQR